MKYPELCGEDDSEDEVDDDDEEKEKVHEEEQEQEETEQQDAAEADAVGAEEPLTEDEEAIVAYLRDDEPLPAELLLKLLNEWWHQEPFR